MLEALSTKAAEVTERFPAADPERCGFRFCSPRQVLKHAEDFRSSCADAQARRLALELADCARAFDPGQPPDVVSGRASDEKAMPQKRQPGTAEGLRGWWETKPQMKAR